MIDIVLQLFLDQMPEWGWAVIVTVSISVIVFWKFFDIYIMHAK